jgi:hypothetical protein
MQNIVRQQNETKLSMGAECTTSSGKSKMRYKIEKLTTTNYDATFTICAKNYIGLAKTLEKSVKNNFSSIDFFIIVADEFDLANKPSDSNILIAKEILPFNQEEWIELTFKYDITEFCTCIKPFVFKYFFESKKYNKVCYLDPDILFSDSIKVIYDELEHCEILLTLHNLFFEIDENKHILEDELRSTGLFNFRFLGLRFGITEKRIVIISTFSEGSFHEFVNVSYLTMIVPNYVEKYSNDVIFKQFADLFEELIN